MVTKDISPFQLLKKAIKSSQAAGLQTFKVTVRQPTTGEVITVEANNAANLQEDEAELAKFRREHGYS